MKTPGAESIGTVRTAALLARGVVMPDPRQVHIGPEVCAAAVAPGVVLHPGTRLVGKTTSIGPGCELGSEGPAVIEGCQLGHKVRLRGGYFAGSVFLDGAAVGSAAHVRPGTLLEEQAEAAHAVGFKQTILLPFVVTGSLVNFCDVLMTGGTSRRDHSEVGSSYVHFNYTPQGDKATASLLGDVPRGVLLDQPRIFLGGQGGLVGPARIAFGTLLPAGHVQRGDIGGEWGAIRPRPAPEAGTAPSVVYRSVARKAACNVVFIGNLHALLAWYRFVRLPHAGADPFRKACADGALRLLEAAVAERLKRMDGFMDALALSAETVSDPVLRGEQIGLVKDWPGLRQKLQAVPPGDPGAAARQRFLRAWSAASDGVDYLDAVGALDAAARSAAREWLDAIVAAAPGPE